MPLDPRRAVLCLLLLLAGRSAPAFALSGWNVETVDADADVGSYAAVTVDPLDRVLIAYRDESNRILKIRRQTPTGWGPPVIPPEEANNFGLWPAIAADAGHVHVVYHQQPGDQGGSGSPYGMRHGEWDGVQWTLRNIFLGGPWSSLALDAQGTPHTSFVDFPGGFVSYSTLVGGTWDTVLFDFTDTAAYTSLSLDRTGAPHVAYSRLGSTGWTLVHAARQTDGTWETVDVLSDPASAPIFASLVVDGLDRIHIAFHDAYGGTLVYYLQDGANESFTTVDSGGVGESASMRLDAAGVPHIAYYDFTRQDLKYVRGDDWIPVVVDSAGAVGTSASLALDAGGRPHIAYHDATERDLKHAWWEPEPAVAAALRPDEAGLLAVRPNPFRAGESVLVSLALPRAAAADLRIYDVQGRLVRTLIARELGAGSHVASWDGTRESGGPAPAGVYFVRLRAGEAESRRKVVMIR